MATITTRWQRRLGVPLAAVSMALTVAACGPSLDATPGTAQVVRPVGHAAVPSVPAATATPQPVATKRPVPPAVKITAVGVVNGQQPWQQPVRLRVKNGSLVSVTATDNDGVDLAGAVTGAVWTSTGPVIPSRTYRLRARVRGLNGRAATHTISITTSAPERTVRADVVLQSGAAVGVGFPVVVYFTRPITDRAAAEHALQVVTSTPIEGAWHWFSSTEVHFRPRVYWPAGTSIKLQVSLEGLELAPGVWGGPDREVSFNVGDSHVSTVDVATQRMTVRVNGKVLATYKVSTGRAMFPTKGGVHLVLSKKPTTVMDSTKLGYPKGSPYYYHETVLWDVRISDGGAFVHAAPWSVADQGKRPVSHGCVNASPVDAVQFYRLSQQGDVVNIVHDPTPPKLDDPGMMDWNYTWAQWVAGSAG